MKSYLIGVREVHISEYRIRANSEADAIKIAMGGGGDLTDCQYSHIHSNPISYVRELEQAT